MSDDATLFKNQRALHFSQDAANDYFSFRILFDQGLTLNAVQLASTSIEKIVKSLLNVLLDGAVEFKTHKISKLVNEYSKILDKHGLSPRKELIEWLEEIYWTRYSTDSYSGGESFDFSERHLLLDVKNFCDKAFAFLRSGNPRFGENYFESPYYELVNSLDKKSDLEKPLTMAPHRICSLLFRGNYPVRVNVSIKAYNPPNPYTRNGLQLDGETLIWNLNFGTISLMDISPEDLVR